MSTDEHGRLTDDFVSLLQALTPPLDSTGHAPGCGYTDDHQECGCAAMGERLHRWLAARVAREDKARAEVVATVEAVLSRHARYPVDDEFLGWTPVDEIREALADHSDALDRVRNDAARIVSRDLSPAAADLARREGWATHARMHPATAAEYEAHATTQPAADDGSSQ